MSGLIEHDDALRWLARQPGSGARCVVFDPPYSRYKPPRGTWDGMGGSVYGPFEFMHKAMLASSRALMRGGILIGFCDWELLTDLGYIASISGLRNRTQLIWVQNYEGTGAIFSGSANPILIASHVSPDIPDTVSPKGPKNWILANGLRGRGTHPYQKPPVVIEYALRRVCRRGDLVLDPFAGSGSSRTAAENLKLDLVWRGCDIDPQYAEEN